MSITSKTSGNAGTKSKLEVSGSVIVKHNSNTQTESPGAFQRFQTTTGNNCRIN